MGNTENISILYYSIHFQTISVTQVMKNIEEEYLFTLIKYATVQIHCHLSGHALFLQQQNTAMAEIYLRCPLLGSSCTN